MPEPTPEAWAQIRHAYEHTDQPLAHICAEHEITVPMLRYRMKRWDWTRRKPLIPRHGPPPVQMTAPADTLFDPPLEGKAKDEAVPPHSPPPAEAEAIVPRLQGAVARVLPAIEATIARLASGTQHPREMEQAGRTLGALTRTLRELNGLLSEHMARIGDAYAYDIPEDPDAFREELARRIAAFMESRADDPSAFGDVAEEAKAGET